MYSRSCHKAEIYASCMHNSMQNTTNKCCDIASRYVEQSYDFRENQIFNEMQP